MPEVASQDRRVFELARKLAEAKRAEDEARAARVMIEEEVVEALGFARQAGSESYDVAGEFGLAKITLRQNVYTKVDEKRLPTVKKALGPKRFKQLFRVKHEVNARGFRELEEEDRDVYLVAADAIQRTPGKVSVEIKTLEVR